MADLSTRISLLATAIANYLRDSILPRLVKSGGATGQFLAKNSGTDFDLTWLTPNTAGYISNASASLSANVTLTTSNTWYDGPFVSLSAGTWLIFGQVTHVRSASTAETIYARITNGNNHFSSTQLYHASSSGAGAVLPMVAVVTLAATTNIKLQMASSSGSSASNIVAAMTANGSGNNATNIVAIRLT